MPPYIVSLRDRVARQPTVAGGKGARLAWLIRHGFSVPPGFIVTTAAFRAAVKAASSFSPLAQDPRGRVTSLPPPLAAAIRRAYRHLGGPVAVRSSLVGEDTSAASFAGQFDTFLNVEGEEAVLAAMVACWNSLCGERAAAYLAQSRATNAGPDLEMAVVVQRMAPAVVAGVAFSADPVSGERCVVIEAATGLGDVVVRGLTQADRYVVDARGVLAENLPVAPGAPVLAEAEVLRLAQVVRELESHAGSPQDIEWAWDGKTFHLLQCRPITALAEQHVFSNRMVGEMAPGLVKPMVYSTTTVAIVREAFGVFFTELIGPNEIDFTRLAPRLFSRIYTDVTLMGELLTRAGLPPNFLEMLLLDERAQKPRMRMRPGLLAVGARLVRMMFRYGRPARYAPRQIAAVEAALTPYREADWSTMSLPDLLGRLDSLVALRDSMIWLFFTTVMSMGMRNSLLSRWAKTHAPDVYFGDLVRGLGGLKSLEPTREIRRLAALAQALTAHEHNRLLEIDDSDDAVLRGALAGSEPGRKLVAGVDSFLERYGFLSSNGSDFSAPTWHERPSLIWRAIGRAAGTAKAGDGATDPATVREAAQRRVREQLGPWRRLVFQRLLVSSVTYLTLREQVSLLMSKIYYQMRRLFLAAADRLVEGGTLADRDDIFYLLYDELSALSDGTLTPADAQVRIGRRKSEMAADALIDPPHVIRGQPTHLRHEAAVPEVASTTEYLSGIIGSAGVAQGRARVIMDPALAPALLNRDDILVVPFSDVGWTPLFPGVGGIVAERGGQLSHTAIVAREHGLPAVVNVKGATRIIHEGQWLTVDGDRGRVYLAPMPA